MTLGSLFDGSGTATLAARMCGIEPVWCSEIEPFPIAVTRARFPQMKHYGNICDIKGDKIEPVDIICGGSPCQDLSVAGKRAGLEGGERSVLFHEQIRIIKEMRHATNDIRPRYAVWENVPGAYSSNKGEDFRCVLEAFCKIADETADIPRPAEGRWAAAGCIVGNGWSVAYRTLDAQYFGVPQRRRRIFLVADLASECAAEILSFEGCLLGNIAEGGETGESAAGKVEGGVGEAVGVDGYNSAVTGKVVSTLGVNCGMSTGRQSVIEPQYFENHGQDERYTGPHDIASCVTAGYGMGGSTKPFIVSPDPIKVLPFNERQITSPQNGNNPDYGDPCHTLSATDGAPTVCIKQEATVFEPTMWDGTSIAPTLTANNAGGNQRMPDKDNFNAVIQPSVFENHQFGGYREGCGAPKASGGDYGGGSENIAVDVAGVDCRNGAECDAAEISLETYHCTTIDGVASTLKSRDWKDPQCVTQRDIVRRLTPTECAKLQGFPPEWCSNISIPNPTESDISFWQSVWDTYQSINGKKPKPVKQIITWLKHPHSDSAEYKMWGNGMALPCVLYIMRGIISAERPII